MAQPLSNEVVSSTTDKDRGKIKKTILLVDDDDFVREHLARMIESAIEQIKTFTAATGAARSNRMASSASTGAGSGAGMRC